jgi:hypothetical protein
MKTWFDDQKAAEPVSPAGAPAGQFKMPAGRACWCPARPVMTVVMPPAATRPHWADLLLSSHHHRESRAALASAGTIVCDADGRPLTAGASEHGAGRHPAPLAAVPGGAPT